MTTSNSGAVFFLGTTRAHYQVLQQPEAQSYDTENGNASTETIYSNPSVPELLWDKEVDDAGNYTTADAHWKCCDQVQVAVKDDKDMMSRAGLKRRAKRTQSEATLFSAEELQPAELNVCDNDSSKKSRRVTLLSFLSSLARRKRRTEGQYLYHLESALTTCTYRESCRCLDCQSRYFDCDESDYGSSEDEYVHHASPPMDTGDDDDEVFVDSVPEDNTSTELLIDEGPQLSVSTETLDLEPDELQWEVAAGTPVFLNYLLTHPITCSIQ